MQGVFSDFQGTGQGSFPGPTSQVMATITVTAAPAPAPAVVNISALKFTQGFQSNTV